jgi:hypothetical protein
LVVFPLRTGRLGQHRVLGAEFFLFFLRLIYSARSSATESRQVVSAAWLGRMAVVNIARRYSRGVLKNSIQVE